VGRKSTVFSGKLQVEEGPDATGLADRMTGLDAVADLDCIGVAVDEGVGGTGGQASKP
jgi:hypothetical protein